MLLVLLLSPLLSPTGRYIARAAWEEGRILARRRPIDSVIADPATPASDRAKLTLVLEARRFAADSIGLRAKRSFTTFAALPRDTLVLVLSAAYRDQLRPVTWWFPIVGRVPYKGFFDPADAVRAERGLAAQGFDTNLRPSAAFSTLGFFNDPLVSTTLRSDSLELANTVIHELTHNTYYAAGQAPFNESFANFVGHRGAAAFFRSRGDDSAARRVDEQWADTKTLGRFWTGVYLALDSAFRANPTSRAARLAARDEIFTHAREQLVTESRTSAAHHTPGHASQRSTRQRCTARSPGLCHGTGRFRCGVRRAGRRSPPRRRPYHCSRQGEPARSIRRAPPRQRARAVT